MGVWMFCINLSVNFFPCIVPILRVIFISNYPNILYISHRANILLNILDVQMLRSFLYHEVHFYKERWISKNLLRLYSKIRLFLFKLYITKILV